jgi:hypothetical protein
MSDENVLDVDPALLAVLPELVIVEVGAQVCDDAMGVVRSGARVHPRSRVPCRP